MLRTTSMSPSNTVGIMRVPTVHIFISPLHILCLLNYVVIGNNTNIYLTHVLLSMLSRVLNFISSILNVYCLIKITLAHNEEPVDPVDFPFTLYSSIMLLYSYINK